MRSAVPVAIHALESEGPFIDRPSVRPSQGLACHLSDSCGDNRYGKPEVSGQSGVGICWALTVGISIPGHFLWHSGFSSGEKLGLLHTLERKV